MKQFDKSDIHFCNDWVDHEIYTERVCDHTLMYVYAGELTVWDEDCKHEVRANECIFIHKSCTIRTSGNAINGEPFHAAYIRLRKRFLKTFFKALSNKGFFFDLSHPSIKTKKISNTPDIKSLFYSLLPYHRENQGLSPIASNLKLQASVFSLLNMRDGFYFILFDFTEKWSYCLSELFC